MILRIHSIRRAGSTPLSASCELRRTLHTNGRIQRDRLTSVWAPSPKGSNVNLEKDGSNGLLVKAGFLRQSHAGIFQTLPLGLRVQEKLERLIDKHMRSIGASKLSLSSISSTELWNRTGRITPETVIIDKDYLLCPTHEEEITKLIAEQGLSIRDLPVRVYQVSRKYRWERRPRQGLLRSREFLMKDLYTFDAGEEQAMKTYHEVKDAYHRFFDDIKLPYRVADADSGNMGGSYSHEFHYPSEMGEDILWSCDTCSYVANDELAERRLPAPNLSAGSDTKIRRRQLLLKLDDNIRLVTVLTPAGDQEQALQVSRVTRQLSLTTGLSVEEVVSQDINVPTQGTLEGPEVKSSLKTLAEAIASAGSVTIVDTQLSHLQPNIDYASASNLHEILGKLVAVLKPRDKSGTLESWAKALAQGESPRAREGVPDEQEESFSQTGSKNTNLPEPLGNAAALQLKPIIADVMPIQANDSCPRCDAGKLKAERAIELGHTFHLGSRYSLELGATYSPEVSRGSRTPMSMGCHGIGISRMIAAIAAVKSDARGLNWPRAVAPWQVCVIYTDQGAKEDAERVYDMLEQDTGAGEVVGGQPGMDAVLDDRSKYSIVQKLTDADIVGYPVLVVLGRSWLRDKKVEVQCRQLGQRVEVDLDRMVGTVRDFLALL